MAGIVLGIWTAIVVLFLVGKRPGVSWGTYLTAGIDYWRVPEKYLRDGWARFPWMALVAWIGAIVVEIVVANAQDFLR